MCLHNCCHCSLVIVTGLLITSFLFSSNRILFEMENVIGKTHFKECNLQYFITNSAVVFAVPRPRIHVFSAYDFIYYYSQTHIDETDHYVGYKYARIKRS